jgi:hypothetical protein
MEESSSPIFSFFEKMGEVRSYPAVITGLAQYGVTARQALAPQVEAAYLAQQKEKGEAQQATKDRDAA